jgi:glycogen debranching enzyme
MKDRGATPFAHPMMLLRPTAETTHVSQSYSVLALNTDGFINEGSEHGLFVHETRLLSRYRLLMNGQLPRRVLQSNVKQHSWLGYYIASPPGVPRGKPDHGSGLMQDDSEQTLEIRVSRFLGNGMHEDIDLCNFSQDATEFELSLEIDADFRDIAEIARPGPPLGRISTEWRQNDDGYQLEFAFQAERQFQHQGGSGTARTSRGITVQILHPQLQPEYSEGAIKFPISLRPHERWHVCVNLVPRIEDKILVPVYKCRSFLGEHSRLDTLRNIYLSESTNFTVPNRETLSHGVCEALAQAKEDLASLRLYDLDVNDRAWTVAAGLPIYVALFGRDTLTAGWEASLCDRRS